MSSFHITLSMYLECKVSMQMQLVTLASKIDVPGEEIDERIIKNLRATLVDLILDNPFDEQAWRHFIFQNLIHPSSTMATKDLKDFIVVNGSFIIETVMECCLEPYP